MRIYRVCRCDYHIEKLSRCGDVDGTTRHEAEHESVAEQPECHQRRVHTEHEHTQIEWVMLCVGEGAGIGRRGGGG